jgi:hypothetical protein
VAATGDSKTQGVDTAAGGPGPRTANAHS